MRDEGAILVFVGPSLPAAARPAHPRWTWRDPAAAGDAYTVDVAQAATVVLIDGLFDEVPAIRHKELLTLMGAGVRLIGGASMGALRAAELQRFGMVGVGAIFRAYADGRIDGDDEVVLLHAPGEFGFSPLTLPLVNVRATLAEAVRRRIVSVGAARAILQAAQDVFYKERTWDVVLDAAGALDPRRAQALAAFAAWVTDGYVDLKRKDALACLARAHDLADERPEATPPPPETLFAAALRDEVGRGFRASTATR